MEHIDGIKLLPIPENFQMMKDHIKNPLLSKIYDQFDYKYIDANNCAETSEKAFIANMIDFLNDYMFITYYKIPSTIFDEDNNDISNFVICVEKICIIIKSVSVAVINDIFKEINETSINTNEPRDANISLEIENFHRSFFPKIEKNKFVEITINPIICYLIRRFYCPSNSFKDKSFFSFNEKSESFESKFKDKVDFLFQKENQSGLHILPYHLGSILKEAEEKSRENQEIEEKNELIEFKEKDFIFLRTLYSGGSSTINLVMHVDNLRLFVKKIFHRDDVKSKDRELNFIQNYSHRCFTRCYGYTKYNGEVSDLIYEFLSNDSIEKIDINKINLFTIICRLYQGLFHLKSNNLIHRDLKPSNILVDHDFVPYINDFETIRDIERVEFTKDFGSCIYASPEQNIENTTVSFPTDIFSLGQIIKKLLEKLGNTEITYSIQHMCEICIKEKPEERASLEQIQNILKHLLFNFYLNDKFVFKQIKQNEKATEMIQMFIENIIFQLSYLKQDKINSYMIDQIYYFVIFNVAKHENIKDIIFGNTSKYIYNTNLARNYTIGRKYLRLAGQQNYALCYTMLGDFYYTGEGVERDVTKAIKYYTLADNLDEKYASRILGVLNIFRNDNQKGVALLEKSIPNEDEKILYSLGVIYYQGYGIEKDYSKARYYFELADNKNFSYATINLGTMYFLGRGVKQNYEKAKELFTKASKLNNIYAFYNLGIIYEKGLGTKRDYSMAKYCFEKAAKENIGCSNMRLGLLYYYGLGVEIDYEKAKEYLEKSAMKKNPEALLQIGEMYFDGKGVEKNILKSKEYFELSAREKYSEAMVRLGFLYYKGLGVEKNYEKSFEFFHSASEKENFNAYFFEALQYENVKYIDYDISQAIELYTKCTENQKEKKIFEVIIKSDDGAFIENIIKENRHYHQALNNKGLIFLSYFEDIETAFNLIQDSAFGEFPIAQNNLGLLYQYFRNDKKNAIYFYDKASKKQLAIAEFNLGFLYEQDNDIDQSIIHYLNAFEYDENPIVFKEEVIDYDDELNDSQAFIICLTDLKLTKHYIKREREEEETKKQFYNESAKKYFLNALLKLILNVLKQNDDNSDSYSFKFQNGNQDKTSNIKDFILNCPLFNRERIENSKWEKNDSNSNEMTTTSKIVLYNDLINEIDNDPDVNDNDDSNCIDEKLILFKRPMVSNDENEIENESDSNLVNQNTDSDNKRKVIHLNSNNIRISSLTSFLQEIIGILFTNTEKIENEINDIINEMESILKTPPYLILFGRIHAKNDQY